MNSYSKWGWRDKLMAEFGIMMLVKAATKRQLYERWLQEQRKASDDGRT